jgi:hypothetical protein
LTPEQRAQAWAQVDALIQEAAIEVERLTERQGDSLIRMTVRELTATLAELHDDEIAEGAP